MNIYTKIKQASNFTDLEKQIGNYILENSEEILIYDIHQFARNCYASTSSIYRFMEKLEVSGFNELKTLLSMQYNDYKKELLETDYNYPFNKEDTHYQITNKISTLYNQTIASTRNLIDYDTLLKVIQLMDKSHKILLLPSVGNIASTQNFHINLLDIGIHAEVETVPYLQYIASSSLDQNDLAIIISYACRGTGLIDCIKVLHEHHVPTVLITSTLPNELFEYTDYKLFFSPYEDSENKIASFASRISLQYLFDIIYACYFNRHYEENIDFKKKYRKTL